MKAIMHDTYAIKETGHNSLGRENYTQAQKELVIITNKIKRTNIAPTEP
ncbi:hypothetical protein [Paenibacillus glucanolyticus]|nr:hypothetical protein [Paenibacillus glucanolyticus]